MGLSGRYDEKVRSSDSPIFADATLARRLEAAEALNARFCTASPPLAAFLEIAGGCAIFVGADSPLTQAVGLGLNGTVTEADVDALEAFFRSRAADVSVDFCPLADPGLLAILSRRGYRATEFNNVLVKRMAGAPIVLAPRVRRAMAGDDDLWSHTVGRGFFEQGDLTTVGDGSGPRDFRHAGRDVLPRGIRDRRAGGRGSAGSARRPRYAVCRQHHRGHSGGRDSIAS